MAAERRGSRTRTAAPDAAPLLTTIYTLTVTAANGCLSTNNPTVTITVNQTPYPGDHGSPSLPVGTSGASASVPNNAGSVYTWTLIGGTITGGQSTRQIAFDAGAPGTTMHLSRLRDQLGMQLADRAPKHAGRLQRRSALASVPRLRSAATHNEITVGCGDGTYCPNNCRFHARRWRSSCSRASSASITFLPATGAIFTDVGVGDFAAAWIEELYNLGVTGGCGNGMFCPDAPVTRAQMAVLLLKTEFGAGFVPDSCAGVFADVPCPATPEFPFSDWIERLYADDITSGCNISPLMYCPNNQNTRGEMAVFVMKTFGLQ